VVGSLFGSGKGSGLESLQLFEALELQYLAELGPGANSLHTRSLPKLLAMDGNSDLKKKAFLKGQACVRAFQKATARLRQCHTQHLHVLLSSSRHHTSTNQPTSRMIDDADSSIEHRVVVTNHKKGCDGFRPRAHFLDKK
jgi:hypothetical protein